MQMVFRAPRLSLARWGIWTLAPIVAALFIALSWPGEMVGNTRVQLAEIERGQLTDWHPPLMAVIWRLIGPVPETLLVLSTFTYWLGMALIADELARRTAPKWGYAMLLVGLTPISIFYLEKVQRDNFMIGFFLVAIGLGAKLGKRFAVVPGLIGCLFRTDALFALPPLLVRHPRWPIRLALCLALSVALLPLTNAINRSVLGATNSHSDKSLQLFDIAGIQKYSGEIVGGRDMTRCYTPFYWDTLEEGCGEFSATPDDVTGTWLNAIAHHPIAYSIHRLKHFNLSIFFLVPPLQECVFAPAHEWCGADGRSLVKDAVIRNAYLWPVTWIVVGIFLLFRPLDPFARSLVWSAMIFSAVHFVISVATAFRYYHWPELALQIAILWQVATVGIPKWRIIVAAVLTVWVIGYAYRYLPLFL